MNQQHRPCRVSAHAGEKEILDLTSSSHRRNAINTQLQEASNTSSTSKHSHTSAGNLSSSTGVLGWGRDGVGSIASGDDRSAVRRSWVGVRSRADVDESRSGRHISRWVSGWSASLADEGDGEGVRGCTVAEVHVVRAAVSDTIWVIGAVVTLVAGVSAKVGAALLADARVEAVEVLLRWASLVGRSARLSAGVARSAIRGRRVVTLTLVQFVSRNHGTEGVDGGEGSRGHDGCRHQAERDDLGEHDG